MLCTTFGRTASSHIDDAAKEGYGIENMRRRYNSTPIADVWDEAERFGIGNEAVIGDTEAARSCGGVAVDDPSADNILYESICPWPVENAP